MPIIPRAPETVRMQASTPVPIASTTDARIRGEQMANFGEALTSFGKQQYEMDQSLKFQEGTDALKNVARQAQMYADQNSQEDGSDYGQKFYEFAEPKTAEVMNEYSGGPRLNSKMQSYLKSAQGEVDTAIVLESTKKLEKFNWNRLETTSDMSADRVRENPIPQLAEAEFKSYNAMLDGMVTTGGMSAENASKAKNAYTQKLGTQYVDGLANKQMYGKALQFLEANQEDPNLFSELDPDQAKSLGFIDSREATGLKEKGELYKVPVLTKGDKVKLSPEMAAIASSMDPNKKAQMIDQLKAKAREATTVKLSDLNAQVNGFEKFALSGGQYSDKDVADLKQQISMNPNLTVEAKKRAMDSVNSANAVGQQLKLVANTPRSQWASIIDGADQKMTLAAQEAAKYDPKMGDVDSDFAVQANRLQNKETLERSLIATAKAQNDDAAKFVLSTDQGISTLYKGTKDGDPKGTENYIRNSLAKQNYLGIPATSQRILTKEEASGISGLIKSMPDSESTANYYASLENQYGQYFPKVLDEIVGKDEDLAGFKTAMYAPQGSRAGLIDAIKNKDVINKSFHQDSALSSQKDIVTTAASNTLKLFRKATLDSGNDVNRASVPNAFQSQIELQVKREMVKNPSADPEALADKAYNDIVGSAYDIRDGGGSTVIVPKVIGGRQMDTEIVSSFMTVYSKPENFSELNVAVPSKYTNADDYFKELSQNSKWVTNSSQTGMKLVQVDPTGNMQPVYDKYGKQVTANYEDINLRPSKKVKDENKGFLGRMFGGR